MNIIVKSGLAIIVSVGVMLGLTMLYSKPAPNNPQVLAETATKAFTTEELAKFDGTDPRMPIYLALDGNVYDISAGRDYYKPGGPYHLLAGKDSSAELRLAGGDIIKRKYPIVGTLVK